MSRNCTVLGVCLLTFNLAVGTDPPAGDPPKLPAIVTQPIALAGGLVNVELNDVLRTLREKHKCTVTVDESAFEKQGTKAVGKKKISLPKVTNPPAGKLVEMLARQVGGTTRWDDGKLELIPGKTRELKSLIGPQDAKMVVALAQPVILEKSIDGSPIKDILEFLKDKYGQPILLDEVGFADAGKRHVGDRQCALTAGNWTLGEVFGALADMVGGVALIGDEQVLIVPVRK